MALTISSALVQCPNLTSSLKHCRLKGPASRFSSSYIRFNRKIPLNGRIICAAASSAGGSSSGSDLNPYEVLGVSPIQGFDMVKTAYSRKKKDAERRGDEATAAQLEKAYDQLMMAQLSDRKKGVTYGSFKMIREDLHHPLTEGISLEEARETGPRNSLEEYMFRGDPPLVVRANVSKLVVRTNKNKEERKEEEPRMEEQEKEAKWQNNASRSIGMLSRSIGREAEILAGKNFICWKSKIAKECQSIDRHVFPIDRRSNWKFPILFS